jgi:hypothetical protein
VTSDSVRLNWDKTGNGTRYAIVLNGRNLGTVRSTSVRIVRMRPDTDYSVQVETSANGTLTPYTKAVTVHTKPPAVVTGGTWLALANALTGRVADLFGSRSADGTPLVLHRSAGTADQQWKLEPVKGQAGNGFLIRSKATDKCVAPLGGTDAAGTPLVQYACNPNSPTQIWHLGTTQFGSSLSTSGGFVIGVSAQWFGGSRLLALQRPGMVRYQSWVAKAG